MNTLMFNETFAHLEFIHLLCKPLLIPEHTHWGVVLSG